MNTSWDALLCSGLGTMYENITGKTLRDKALGFGAMYETIMVKTYRDKAWVSGQGTEI